MNETLAIILSSGLISALISFLSIFLMLGTYKQKVDANEKSIEKYDDKISGLSDRVSRLEGGVDRDRVHHSEYIQRQSPLSLTEKGKAVLLDSKGKDFVDSNKETLLKAIKTSNPKTAYDVQELSRDVLKKEMNNETFNIIKEYAFRQGLSLDLIIDVMGIYLRDEILSKFGFNHNDLPD